jgi:hypothetical protein
MTVWGEGVRRFEGRRDVVAGARGFEGRPDVWSGLPVSWVG